MDKFVYIDCEWNRQGTLLCVVTCIDEHYSFYKGDDLHTIKTVLECYNNKEYTFVGHNIKSDSLTIYENTGVLLEKVYDTMIAFQQLTNGKELRAGLGAVVKSLLFTDIDKGLQSSFLDKYDYNFSEEEIEYIMSDVKFLPNLKEKLDGGLTKYGMWKSFTIDMEVLPSLVLIESKGMLVDKDKWNLLIDQWEQEAKELEDGLYKELDRLGFPYIRLCMVGKKIIKWEYDKLNLNSSKQIKELFNYFEVPLPINKEEKESTNKDLLASINIDKPDNVLNKFIDTFIKYKKKIKLISSFGHNITDNLRDGLTLHTEYTQCFTSTGRLSSGKNKLKPYTINVQNIPARSKEGKGIMECIIAPQGYNIICCDMSGAELRIVGSLSQDKILLDNFNAGGDFHSELASCSWEVICKHKGWEYQPIINKIHNPVWLDTDFRTIHKQVNFGLVYGCTAKRIAEVLHIPLQWASEAKSLIEKKVPKLLNYLKSQQEFAKKNGYLANPFTNRRKYNLISTEASNWQIQSSNAEAMKIALAELRKYIKNNGVNGYMINTVHDSVVVCLNENESHEFIKTIMAESLGKFLVGMNGEADISIAKYWAK